MVDRLQGNEVSLIADQVHGESRILELPVENYSSGWSSPELLQYHVTCKGKVIKVYAATAEVQHFIFFFHPEKARGSAKNLSQCLLEPGLSSIFLARLRHLLIFARLWA